MNSDEKMIQEATRRGLMDCIILDDFGVSDKMGVAEMVENMPDELFSNLYESFLKIDPIETKQSLDSMYSDYLIETNSSGVVIGKQNVWEDKRNNVLISEADNEKSDQDKFNDALVKVAMTASAPVLIKFIVDEYRKPGGKDLVEDGVKHLKRKVPAAYARIQKAPIIRQILPRAGAVKVKSDKAIDTISKAADKVDATLAKIKRGTTSRNAMIGLAVLGGVTAVATAMQYTYQRYMSKAAKSCGGKSGRERTSCILKFKINAASQAVKAAEVMLDGCEDKSDPQKCKYSIQKKIWYWNKRKQKYQDKLAKLAQSKSQFRTHKRM